jgi:membrane protein
MNDNPRPSLVRRLRAAERGLWTGESLAQGGLAGVLGSVWRTVSGTARGTFGNQLPQRAAALTYYTLMAIGPVLALGLTVSGFILSRQNADGENPAKRAMVTAIEYIAPQVTAGRAQAGGHPTLAEINRDLDSMVDRLLANAASGTAGLVGLALIIGLAVLMLGRVEDALNSTWGSEQGRGWGERFARYCLFLILFFLLGGASLAVLSVGAVIEQASSATAGLSGWITALPGGGTLVSFLQGRGPELITLVLLGGALAALYRWLPNARVRWSSAAVGGLAAGGLILVNHELAAAYIGKVVEFRSLYGELGIVPVLMFGGYLSWLIVLVGGQVAYAFQNRRNFANHRGWEGLCHRARRAVAFSCLTESLRRYRAGEPAPTVEELSARTRVPASVTESCLRRLHGLGLLAPVSLAEGKEQGHTPARPLDALTVGELWQLLDSEAGGVLEDGKGAASCCPQLEELTARLLRSPEAAQRLGDLA